MWRGIDVSANNGTVNWPQVAASGISWVAVKVSEGSGWVDPMGAANLVGAKAAGLTAIPYGFSRQDLGTNPEDEAAFLLAHSGDAPLVVLDMEMPEADGPDLSWWALTFLNHVQDAGKAIYLYSYPYYIQTRLQDPKLAAFGLWLATYAPSFVVPKPWASVAMWQNADNGVVPGIGGQVDTDVSFVDLSSIGKPVAPRGVMLSAEWLEKDPKPNDAIPNAHAPKGAGVAIILDQYGKPWQASNQYGEWVCIQWKQYQGFVLASQVQY